MLLEIFGQLCFGLLVLIATLSVLFYFYLKKSYSFWKKAGVVGPKPEMIYGNLKRVYTLKETEAECTERIFDEYPKERYVGIYNLWKPALLLRDVELVTDICVNDFANFMDHPQICTDEGTDVIIHSLFFLRGEKWRQRRQVLTKLFTPKKIKEYMVCAEKTLTMLTTELAASADAGDDVDVTDLFEKTAAKFISESFYGLDLTNDASTTTKLVEGSNVFSFPPPATVLKSLLFAVAPFINKILHLKTFPTNIWDIFSKFTHQLFSLRDSNQEERNDLIDVLKNLMFEELKNNKKITFDEAVAHVYVFFIASHHTTQMTICHTLLQVSMRPGVQEKLHAELDEILQGSESISYETLKKLTYLDCVVKETMRIYPLLGVLKRVCNRPYKVSEKLTIPAGIDIFIPVSSIHNSPENFPNPKEFRPERFMVDQWDNNPAYMPFGKGPRLCIGMRFGEAMTRLTLAKILQKFTVEPSKKMKLPLEFDPKSLLITNRPSGGVWNKFRRRNITSAGVY